MSPAQSQPKSRNRLVGQAAAAQIAVSRLSRLRLQALVEKAGGLPVDFIDPHFSGRRPVLLLFRHGHPGARRQKADSLRIIKMLRLHDKADDVAALAAAEAVKRLVLRIDNKGRRFFGMKRAQRFLPSALRV